MLIELMIPMMLSLRAMEEMKETDVVLRVTLGVNPNPIPERVNGLDWELQIACAGEVITGLKKGMILGREVAMAMSKSSENETAVNGERPVFWSVIAVVLNTYITFEKTPKK